MNFFSCFDFCNTSPEQNGAVVSYPVQKQDQAGQSDLVSRIYEGPDCPPDLFACDSARQCSHVYGRTSIWSVTSQNPDEEPHGSRGQKEAHLDCLEDFENEDGLSCLIVPTFSMPQLLHQPEAAVPLWAWNSEPTCAPRFSRSSQYSGYSKDKPLNRRVNNCKCCRKQWCKFCEEKCLEAHSSVMLPGNADVGNLFSSSVASTSIKVSPPGSPRKSPSGKSYKIQKTCCACLCATRSLRKCADSFSDCKGSHCFQNKNRLDTDLPEPFGNPGSVTSSSFKAPCCCQSGKSQLRPSDAASCHSDRASFRTDVGCAAASSSSDMKVPPDEEVMRGSFIAPMMPASIISPYHRKIQPENFKARLFPSGPTIVTTIVPLGPQSTHMICPHCHSEIDSATKTSPSRMAWLASLLICCLGCPFGCCLIPFCIDDCMNTDHTCPSCKTYLGQHSRN